MALLLSSEDSATGTRTVPLVPVRGVVVFPHTEIALTFGRPRSVAAVEAASKTDNLMVLVSQKDPRLTKPTMSDLFQVGTMVKVVRTLPSEEVINALVRGLDRIQLIKIDDSGSFPKAQVRILPEIEEKDDEVLALVQYLKKNFRKAVGMGKSADLMAVMNLMGEGGSPAEIVDQAASVLELEVKDKQQILEILSVKKRLQKATEYLTNEMKVLKLEKRIASKTKNKFEKSVREAMLRERKKIIEKELGELDEDGQEIKDLKDKIRKAGLPAKIALKAKKELDRLAALNPQHPERGYIRTYLEVLTDLPWSKSSVSKLTLEKAERVLNEDHHGLEKVKERIVEYLAVMKLREAIAQRSKNQKSRFKKTLVSGPTILCFVGPPGVGKTSIGKSIAKALDREFVRLSLGGVRDEAEIRGHRRTYVGAMPGRIIQGIKNAGTNNPVFMLDEIDKVGADFRGDPSSALLEALDPEQNSEFSDHYLEVPFDLSKVMFITTANVLHTIPPALRDRMEIITFPGYTEDEKFAIGKKYLWPKQLEVNGLGKNKVAIQDSAIRSVISHYTREAGVRELERTLATICRKIARRVAEKKRYTATVTKTSLRGFLGPQKFRPILAETQDEVGMVTGLAYTETGGDVLFIEVALMPGKGRLILTGKLGKVMRESAQAAFSYVRSRWEHLKLEKDFYKHQDIHVHVPEGAVPKDGPSAGLAMATALVSAFTKKPVFRDLGMTGEITLRGRALEIGGVKEKVIAAHRAGLKRIVMPKDNEKNLDDVPAKVKKDIEFIFVDHVDEVLKVALKRPAKPRAKKPIQ